MADCVFCIGSGLWPGLSKLIEECGEVAQVAGKIIGNEGRADHWDGSHLPTRLAEELADLEAAILFIKQHNELPCNAARVGEKLARFNKWHRETAAAPTRLQVARAEGYTEELQRTGRIA